MLSTERQEEQINLRSRIVVRPDNVVCSTVDPSCSNSLLHEPSRTLTLLGTLLCLRLSN